MTIEQTVEIPANRRLTIDDECPLCAIYNEPNEETIAAIEETRAMMRGEIPSIEFDTAEAFLADLKS